MKGKDKVLVDGFNYRDYSVILLVPDLTDQSKKSFQSPMSRKGFFILLC